MTRGASIRDVALEDEVTPKEGSIEGAKDIKTPATETRPKAIKRQQATQQPTQIQPQQPRTNPHKRTQEDGQTDKGKGTLK